MASEEKARSAGKWTHLVSIQVNDGSSGDAFHSFKQKLKEKIYIDIYLHHVYLSSFFKCYYYFGQ